MGELDFSDLDIQDEREAGLFCNLITRSIQNNLEDNLPFSFDCSCRVRFFRRRIEFNCGADFCFSDIKELLDIDNPLPLSDESCLKPSVSGTGRFNGDANTRICSGATTLTLNITMLEEITGLEISSNTEEEFEVPDSCIAVETHRQRAHDLYVLFGDHCWHQLPLCCFARVGVEFSSIVKI